MGAMVDDKQAQGIMGFVVEGRIRANLVAGVKRVTVDGKECFVQPTIFDDVAHDSSLAQDEIFGPVLSVIAFAAETEAVTMANDTIYGFAASAWADNLPSALRASDAIHTSTVSVNTVDALSALTPFGGMKQSGFGRDLSLHSLEKYTALKIIWIKYKA